MENEDKNAVTTEPSAEPAPAGDSNAAGTEESPRPKKPAPPLWQYAVALVVSGAAIAAAFQSYDRAAHMNESWGGTNIATGPTLSVDEQIAKIKSDTTMPKDAKARALAALQMAKAREVPVKR